MGVLTMFRAMFSGLLAATLVYFCGMAYTGAHTTTHYVSAQIN